MLRPATDRLWPSIPRRPKAISRARPATAGGKTVGRSMNVSNARLSGKRRRAISRARGVPKRSVSSVAVADVHKLRKIARRAIGWAKWILISARSVRQMRASRGKIRNRIRGMADQNSPSPAPCGHALGVPCLADTDANHLRCFTRSHGQMRPGSVWRIRMIPTQLCLFRKK